MKTIAEQLNVKEFPFVIRDKNGNGIYWEFYNKYWVKNEYDDQGNQIYWENSNGSWLKAEYDDQGNQIYWENSNGSWFKKEYDDKSNLISYKDSNDNWGKHIYDLNDNEIYFETGIGVVFDKRVTELTLDQIAEKFGIEVSQLKIKK